MIHLLKAIFKQSLAEVEVKGDGNLPCYEEARKISTTFTDSELNNIPHKLNNSQTKKILLIIF